MTHWLNNWIQTLVRMAGGPGHLRFYLQPLVALVLGVRDGRLDARAGTPPYLYQLLTNTGHRADMLRDALRAIWKPLLIASLMDAVLQILVQRTLNLGYAVLTGCLLVGVPYVLTRAVSDRIATAHLRGLHRRRRAS